jgi:hypothetical protein
MFNMPITATAQLETAIRAHSMQLLPHGYLELKQAHDIFAQRWRNGVLDRELVRIAGLSMLLFNNAAASGKLHAAAAATDLMQLAPQLYCLLVTSCKCYSAAVGRAGSRMFQQSGDEGLGMLWKSIEVVGSFTECLATSLAMGYLIVPDTSAEAEDLSSGHGKGSSSSSRPGRSAQQGSSSNSSKERQLMSGSSPWLHLTGRALLLLSQLLMLLPQTGCPFPAAGRQAGSNSGHVIITVKIWLKVVELLQQQLQALKLAGVSDVDAATVNWHSKLLSHRYDW